MKTKFAGSMLAALIAFSFLISACKPDPVVTGNSLTTAQVGEVVMEDTLSLGYNNMDDVSDSRSYTLPFTGTQMQVTVSSILSAGSAEVEVVSPGGAKLYSKSVSGMAADVKTLTTGAGDYTVNVSFSNAGGQLAVTVIRQD